MTMAPKTFWKLCENHDWYYMYSDDGRVYSRGKEEGDRLHELTVLNPSLKPILDDWIRWVDSDDPAKHDNMPPIPATVPAQNEQSEQK